MKKNSTLVAASLVSLALMGCGSGADTRDEAATAPTNGTSDMMGGDNEQPNPSLGTAEGEDVGDVDVKMTPNAQHSAEEMTGEEELQDQRPEPQ